MEVDFGPQQRPPNTIERGMVSRLGATNRPTVYLGTKIAAGQTMSYRPVPVTLGSPQFQTLEAGGFNVVDARFPPKLWIPPHIHERATMAVMLEGSFDCVFPTRSVDCLPSTVHTEPAEERHGNRVGTAGAHVLVVQPNHERCDALRPHTRLLDSINHVPGSPAPGLAWRLSR